MSDGRFLVLGALGLLGAATVVRGSKGVVRKARGAPVDADVLTVTAEGYHFDLPNAWSDRVRTSLTTTTAHNERGRSARPEEETFLLHADGSTFGSYDKVRLDQDPTREPTVDGWKIDADAGFAERLELRAPYGVQIYLGLTPAGPWRQATWGLQAFDWVRVQPRFIFTPGKSDRSGQYMRLNRYELDGFWTGEADTARCLQFRPAPAPGGSRGIVRRGRGDPSKADAIEKLRAFKLRWHWDEKQKRVTELWSDGTIIAMLDGRDEAYNYFIGNLYDAGLASVMRLPAYLDYPHRVPLSAIALGSHRGMKPGESENVMVSWDNAPHLGGNNAFTFRGNRPELYQVMEAVGVVLGVPAVWRHR